MDEFGEYLRQQAFNTIRDVTLICIGIVLVILVVSFIFYYLERK